VEACTCQITVEPGITITAPRTTSSDIWRHKASSCGCRRWQPIFYLVLNEEYATMIARDWNVKHSGSGYVTRFRVRRPFLDRYETHQVAPSTGRSDTRGGTPAGRGVAVGRGRGRTERRLLP
jgi:hypothetical protein